MLFLWWLNKGLFRIGDYLNGDQPLQYFKDTLHRPSSEIFRYNQLIFFVCSKLNLLAGPLTLTDFELSCQTKCLFRGRVSAVYATLTDKTTKLHYMTQWERDLNTIFELSDWQDIAYAFSKVSINTLIEANYKTLLRWYFVLARVARRHPSTSPICFRCCGQMGTVYHVWWQCPVVSRFWIRLDIFSN